MTPAWDIYARELMPLGFGHPLWGPEPCLQFGEIRLGDVGYLRDGRFRFLFNAMRDAEDPVNVQRGVPYGFEVFDPPDPMIVHDLNEITQTEIHSKNLRSTSVSTTASAGLAPASTSIGLRYQCSEDSGALLILKQPRHKTSLDCSMHIRRYMRTHLSNWCEFANDHLGIGLEDKDIIFVSGFIKTPVWATAAFHNSNSSGELVISGGAFGSSASGEFRVSMSKGSNPSVFSRVGPLQRLSSCEKGSESSEDTFDQCIFLNYYKMKTRKFRRPAVMRAAAGPHELPDDPDDHSGPSSTSPGYDSQASSYEDEYDAFKQYYDPVGSLLDYLLKHGDTQTACASYEDLFALFKDGVLPRDIGSALEMLQPSVSDDTACALIRSCEDNVSLPQSGTIDVTASRETPSRVADQAIAARHSSSSLINNPPPPAKAKTLPPRGLLSECFKADGVNAKKVSTPSRTHPSDINTRPNKRSAQDLKVSKMTPKRMSPADEDCVQCRRRGLTCSRTTPVCIFCAKRRIECIYDAQPTDWEDATIPPAATHGMITRTRSHASLEPSKETMAPAAIRLRMLQNEIPEELRRSLLWERQVNGKRLNAPGAFPGQPNRDRAEVAPPIVVDQKVATAQFSAVRSLSAPSMFGATLDISIPSKRAIDGDLDKGSLLREKRSGHKFFRPAISLPHGFRLWREGSDAPALA